jgi:hypothetical protein
MSRYTPGIVLILGLITSASAVILPPTDDSSGTNTVSGRPPVVTRRTLTSLNGSAMTLPVSKTRTAFIRFAVEDSGFSAETVEQARLTIYLPSVTKVGGLGLHLVTQDWEETFTGPTRIQPTIDETFMTIPWTSVVKRKFIILDVTQQVKDWLSNPGSNFGFAVTSPDGVVVATLGSKEGSASGYPPLLEIEGTGATAANLPSSIVKRDADGNFLVGTITGNLLGNASSAMTADSATNFTGLLAGDVTGTQGATIIANGAVNSAKIAAGAVGNSNLANPAVTITPGTGLSGGGLVALGGAVTLSNAGVLSLTGGGGITVTGETGTITLGSNATSSSTPSAIVMRDSNGDFSARSITAASFVGNGAGLTGLRPKIDRQATHLPGPISNTTTIYNDLLVIRTNDLGEPGCYKITVSTGFLRGSDTNARGTFAIAIDDNNISTLEWANFIAGLTLNSDEVAWTVVAHNVPADSVIKFRFKQSFNGGSQGIRVLDPRLTIDGVPQSYVVE